MLLTPVDLRTSLLNFPNWYFKKKRNYRQPNYWCLEKLLPVMYCNFNSIQNYAEKIAPIFCDFSKSLVPFKMGFLIESKIPVKVLPSRGSRVELFRKRWKFRIFWVTSDRKNWAKPRIRVFWVPEKSWEITRNFLTLDIFYILKTVLINII